MGAFSGARDAAQYVAELTKQLRELQGLPLGQLSDNFKQVLSDAKGAVKGVEDLIAKGKEARGVLDDLAKAHRAAAEMNAKFRGEGAPYEARVEEGATVGPSWGELFKPEEIIKNISKETAEQNAAQNQSLANALKDFSDRIDKWAGNDNNYWSRLFKEEIPYLTSGARSAVEANGMITQILNAYLPGMKNELLQNPNMPSEMRKLLEELLQYAMSGQQKIDNLAKRFDENNAAQRESDETMRRIHDRQEEMDKFVEDIGKGVTKVQDQVRDQTKHVEHVYSVVQGIGNSYGALAKSAVSVEQNSKNVTSRLEGLGNSYGALAKSAVSLAQDSKHVAMAAKSGAEVLGEARNKINEAAAEQKKFRDEFMAEQKRRADEIKKEMKERADEQKRNAEALRQNIHYDLLHGAYSPGGYFGVAIPLSDDIERRLLHGG